MPTFNLILLDTLTYSVSIRLSSGVRPPLPREDKILLHPYLMANSCENELTHSMSALKFDSSSTDKLGPIPEHSRGEGTGGDKVHRIPFRPIQENGYRPKINISLAVETRAPIFGIDNTNQSICRPY